jgi:zinc-ribbon domain
MTKKVATPKLFRRFRGTHCVRPHVRLQLVIACLGCTTPILASAHTMDGVLPLFGAILALPAILAAVTATSGRRLVDFLLLIGLQLFLMHSSFRVLPSDWLRRDNHSWTLLYSIWCGSIILVVVWRVSQVLRRRRTLRSLLPFSSSGEPDRPPRRQPAPVNPGPAVCPNCRADIQTTDQSCPKCGADFSQDVGWRPVAK